MGRLIAVALCGGVLMLSSRALAADAANGQGAEEDWAIHGQATFVLQANARFHSPYQGPNSLDHHAQAKETFDATAYLGVRPWKGAELWVNPEIDQGFGLSNTLGVAGFPSGEAYKVGKAAPYAKFPRWFLRQTFDLGGDTEKVDSDLNQLAGTRTADRLVFTIGKFGVVDVFDTNQQAHDPRSDFMNWSVIDAGTFDYAANAWGYTYGAAAELYSGNCTFRAGLFDLSKVPNSVELDPAFRQYELDGEFELRESIAGHAGSIKLTAFLNRGRMARFADAIALAERTGQPPDVSAVRRYRSRAGISFNVEQEVSKRVSLFLKGGVANGSIEPYEFADIDRTIAGGVTIDGSSWGRADDKLGIAAVQNMISRIHQRYLDLGGLGILVGDGKLPHPGPEQIAEAYYDVALAKPLHLSLDGQVVRNPAYNRDRGPVPVGAIRLHAQF